MGTNYYWRHEERHCHACGGEIKPKTVDTHIGKSSGGWRFLFHAPKDGPESWRAWRDKLASGGVIVSEYGYDVPIGEFERIVEKQTGERKQSDRHEGYFEDAEGYVFSRGEFC